MRLSFHPFQPKTIPTTILISMDTYLAIQVARLGGAQEELRSARVGTSVGHGENARSGVFQLEVLILQFATAARSID